MLILVAPSAAYAATLYLGPSGVGSSKTFYSTPRYKTNTGTATMHVTSDPQCGGTMYTGFRSTSAYPGEATQFPNSTVGTTVQYRNVGAPPAVQYTFAGAHYYYFNAQDYGVGDCYGNWSGTVVW